MKAKIRAAINMTPEERKQAKIEAKRRLNASGIPRDARGRILPGYGGREGRTILGRPRKVLDRDKVRRLHQQGYGVRAIAEQIDGVSHMTVQRIVTA